MQTVIPFLWFEKDAEAACELLRLDLQERRDGTGHPLRCCQPRPEGLGHDRVLRAGGPGSMMGMVKLDLALLKLAYDAA
ncbi:MAG: hypothetical protein BroJett024_18640 [Alphaproteobacteria bacterium]|nr:MAG: hypothetical protein BroJett024_18640 [Alphaproteobacteria bacterium]